MNYFKSKNKRCAKLKSPRFIAKNTLHANEMNMSYLARSWGKNPVITHFRLSLFSVYNFYVKKTIQNRAKMSKQQQQYNSIYDREKNAHPPIIVINVVFSLFYFFSRSFCFMALESGFFSQLTEITRHHFNYYLDDVIEVAKRIIAHSHTILL